MRYLLTVTIFLLAFLPRPTVRAEALQPAACWAYIGTFTASGSQGIYRLKLDLASGQLTPDGLAATADNPNYLTLHPRLPILYAVTGERETKSAGQVAAYAIAPATGALTLLNSQSTGSALACYVSITPDAKTALVASYVAGTVSALPLNQDGQLNPPASVIAHHGHSADPHRQQAPHAHCIDPDPAGRFALSADLGLDKVLVYRLNAAAADTPQTPALTANDPPALALAPGCGPRHLAFDPAGKCIYIVSEMGTSVTACHYDAARGALAAFQTISTLAADAQGENSGAEIRIHPSGRFLYTSNRGCNTIAGFTIDPQTSRLTPISQTSTQGKTPRGFGLDPTGTVLVALNQDSNTIVTFHINRQSGTLTAADHATVPSPVSIVIVPIAR